MGNMETLKTGTTTIGMKFKDGVLIAADKRATAGNLIVDKKAHKVHVVTDNLALTIAGSVSDAQRIVMLIKSELKLISLQTGRVNNVKEAAHLLGNIVYSKIRQPSMMPAIAHFLLAGKDTQGYHLFDIFPDGSITEIDDYVSSGSGSVFVYGVLETLYKKDMSLNDSKDLIIKSINSAIQRDNASGNGIDIVLIDDSGAKKIADYEISSKMSE
jgi:proteasome beta subunit